ncbi:hypothetical protein TELCIR_07457 [Teladorsagia circumcincta]|uniref:Uncharacterized protein n=1 Tax=Teladorsagia circumcincta TaxID=45464 RepID=A0A2G9UKA6_TELCI|nr:hypothetical protein TELCIR_07457 [Teladorsagia circumcincta]
MVPRYKSMGFPIEGQHTFYQGFTTKLVSDLNDKEYEAMLSYSNEVTGSDRSHLLRLHFNLDFTEGATLTDSTARVRGFASTTTTGERDKHLFKISPVYAEGINEAFAVIQPLLIKILEKDPDAIALISTWSESAGEQLRPFLQEKCIDSKTTGYTLFTRPYSSTMDFSRMFAAHNHSGHFDA